MSLVQGFLVKIQRYLDKGVIFSLPAPRNGSKFSQFVQGMFELMSNSEECFVTMAVYFDRIIQRHNTLINENNMTRLIFISGVLAIKMQDDFSYKNSYFAQVSGVPNHEINYLEIDFLQWIEYKLTINQEEYDKYYNSLLNF